MENQKHTGKFIRPIKDLEGWRQLLAGPDKQWRTGYSAKALAYCWWEARDFPLEIKEVFQKSRVLIFQDIRMLMAFPEHKVPLPGGRRASQSDLFVLAVGNGQLVCIMVEGKVSEPFGDSIGDWKAHSKGSRQRRLSYLCRLLGLNIATVDHIRYQLLHRTASALIEAGKFTAPNALMLVHSFSTENAWFNDYQRFLALFGVTTEPNSLSFARSIHGVKLYFGWVKGDSRYLDR